MDIKTQVKEICIRLKELTDIHSDIISDKTSRIDSEVFSLLDGDKPKIMVYGIYNAGKSTLINAITGKAVAEVRDCPATWKIDEYDNGDYILVDSPGVDAPVEHQQITEENISRCHAILYVISTKGGFESVKNYNNMYNLMKMGKPFIIVINDKEGDPDLNNSQNINKIKYKVIENLRKVSGNNGIENKFDTIAVNGKRAFDALTKNKIRLYEKSNVELLKQRILYFLDGGQALRIFIAPINNLIAIIDEIKEEMQKSVNPAQSDELNSYFRVLNQKRKNIIEELPYQLDSAVTRYEATFIQSAYQEDENKWEENFRKLYEEAELICQNSIDGLSACLKSTFPNIDFSRAFSDTYVNTSADIGEIPDVQVDDSYHAEYQDNSYNNNYSYDSDTFSSILSAGKSLALNSLTGSDGVKSSVIPPIKPDPNIIIALANLLMGNSRKKREKEMQEFIELQEQAKQRNLEAEAKANAEAKRRQEIRIQVETQIHQMRIELKKNITRQIMKLFDNAENCVTDMINQNNERNETVSQVIRELNTLREEAMTVRSTIRS